MSVNGKREFDLLNRIGFIRVSGSEEEAKAANLLADEIKKMGLNAVIDEFKVDDAVISKVKFEVLEPYYQEYEATAYKCCGNADGLEGELVYVDDGTSQADISKMKGKIVLINGYLRIDAYKRMVENGAIGFITFQGSLLDKREESDLDTRKLRKNLRECGLIPGMNIRVQDAWDIVTRKASKVRLTIEQENIDVTSRNVYTTIQGTEKPDEIVVFGAHFDSVPFSTGVYDNGAGSVIIMDVLREFVATPPKRTVQFCWFGSEEVGLEGSKYFVKTYEETVKKTVLMINVDVAGAPLGRDVAMCTAENCLVDYINYIACDHNFSINVKQDIYSSDSTPFADKGVPAVSFCRFGAQGAAFIHCRHDVIQYISADALESTAHFVNTFAQSIVNTQVFPVPRTMPSNMVEKIDKYLNKKTTDKND